MRGFHSASYGDAFADVYDDWYHDVSDVALTVALIGRLCPAGGSVLELGVGTGRIAVPLAAAGFAVTGIDSSHAMLQHLAGNDPHRTVVTVSGDMVDDLPDGPFDVVLAAYNTLFNLLDAERQLACFREVSRRLAPGGAFVVEAFVPRADGNLDVDLHQQRSQVTVRELRADRVVLSASTHDPASHRAEGQFIEITEAGGVRLRPWSVRYSTPAELDHFATQCGLMVDARWADVGQSQFDEGSEQHVTVYRSTHTPPTAGTVVP